MFSGKVRVTQFIRRLRGGSQPKLVKASDGYLYVVKFSGNAQGPNLIFNEVMGSELYRRCGISTPEWKALDITAEFLVNNPACRIETEKDLLRPPIGLCFGSRYLGSSDANLFDVLPGASYSRIFNRSSFWLAWALDICAGHADNRQVIFSGKEGGRYEAVFLDHGHLFGGPDGLRNPDPIVSRYLDSRVYPEITKSEMRKLKKFRLEHAGDLWNVAMSLPEEWRPKSALRNFEATLKKLDSRRSLDDVLNLALCLSELRGRFSIWPKEVYRPVMAIANRLPSAT